MSVVTLNKIYNINLQTLNLYFRQLKSLPTEITNLLNLQCLKLTRNELKSLPAEIGNLINLKELY